MIADYGANIERKFDRNNKPEARQCGLRLIAECPCGRDVTDLLFVEENLHHLHSRHSH